MKKTLRLIEQAYTLLEQDAPAPAPEAAAQPDPTMPAEAPPAEDEPRMLPFTSESEVTYIKTLIKILQAVKIGRAHV